MKSQSISVRRQTFARLEAYCARFGGTPSKVIQQFLLEYQPFGENLPKPLERVNKVFRDTIVLPRVKAEPEHPTDPDPVDRELPRQETKGSDLIPPDRHGFTPFQKKDVRTGGYNEF